VTVKLLSLSLLALMAASGALPAACERKIGEDDPKPATQATTTLPTVPSYSAIPVSDFNLDGGDDVLTLATKYEANGQYWLARLLMEPRALSEDGKTEDLVLLARICDKQEDDACVIKCNARLPKNLQLPVKKREAGARAPMPSSLASARPDDNTDFGKAQRFLLTGKSQDARAVLEPKFLGGRASLDEIRLLREVCKSQGDRMCVAMCNSKLP
jgi:hypothetical protein